MSEFNREDRYIVIKRSDIDKAPAVVRGEFLKHCRRLHDAILSAGTPARSFVVVEQDWPEYEPVWRMIERRMNGEPCELAALREELATANNAYRIVLDTSRQMFERMTAAEQRCAELERLKGGHKWQYEHGSVLLEFDAENVEENIASGTKIRLIDGAGNVLYQREASQPAPVSVVLSEPVGKVVEFGNGLKEVSWIKGKMPELGSMLYASAPTLLLPARRTADDFQSENAKYESADALADTWNACIDKVKEMNQ